MPAYVQYGRGKTNYFSLVIKVKSSKKKKKKTNGDGFACLTTALPNSSFDSLHLQEYFTMHLSNGMSVNAYKKRRYYLSFRKMKYKPLKLL